MLAIISGGIAGLICLIGITILLLRRLLDERIRATSKPMDIIILLWIFITLVLGLISIWFSLGHRDGSVMLVLGHWAQSIVTFRSGAADSLLAAPIIYRIHLMFGMTVFVLFPFTRLVHVWSGFAAVTYLTRSYQIVRQRG
jgi:nitrate reductase gamma subunit